MPPNRLAHDVAFAATHNVLELFDLRPEQVNEAFGAVYQALMAALESYDMHKEREAARLRPSRN